MLTEKQLELAAKRYCEIKGVDPESKASHSPKPNEDETVNMVMLISPLWTLVADLIKEQDIIFNCIEYARCINTNAQSKE